MVAGIGFLLLQFKFAKKQVTRKLSLILKLLKIDFCSKPIITKKVSKNS